MYSSMACYLGADRSIRIWNAPHRVETARLAQNAPVLAVAWMIDDVGVVSLGQDGLISKWTRNVSDRGTD